MSGNGGVHGRDHWIKTKSEHLKYTITREKNGRKRVWNVLFIKRLKWTKETVSEIHRDDGTVKKKSDFTFDLVLEWKKKAA